MKRGGRLVAATMAWAVVVAFAGRDARAATWETSVKPRDGDTFDKAEFRLWLDDEAHAKRAPVRALLVLAPGWNGDGRGLADDAGWRALAREIGAGVVGVHLRTDRVEDGRRLYHRAEGGSADAWRRAVRRLAETSGRRELADVPWLMWGHSAGGQWAYGVAGIHPERVAAFVAAKGGVYETEVSDKIRQVPGLFVAGENDELRRGMAINACFEAGREKGAPWAMAWEVGAGHETGKSVRLARVYLGEIAALRLPGDSRGTSRPLKPGDGWTGSRATYRRLDPVPPGTNPARTVWLPGPASAELWKALGHDGADDDAQ